MQLNDKVQHVYLVGAKSLGAYGGYETFVYKLTEYHQNAQNKKLAQQEPADTVPIQLEPSFETPEEMKGESA